MLAAQRVMMECAVQNTRADIGWPMVAMRKPCWWCLRLLIFVGLHGLGALCSVQITRAGVDAKIDRLGQNSADWSAVFISAWMIIGWDKSAQGEWTVALESRQGR